MEILMSLQPYIRQLKPRSEGNINHVDRIQNFLNKKFISEAYDFFPSDIDGIKNKLSFESQEKGDFSPKDFMMMQVLSVKGLRG